jgi:hypothetical protein
MPHLTCNCPICPTSTLPITIACHGLDLRAMTDKDHDNDTSELQKFGVLCLLELKYTKTQFRNWNST